MCWCNREKVWEEYIVTSILMFCTVLYCEKLDVIGDDCSTCWTEQKYIYCFR